MLLPAKKFKMLKLHAIDGDIGKAKEFYFDDHHWTVRYLVADSGEWLTNRQVLLSPYALKPADMAELVLPVDLTKKQIEESPSLDSHQPVSRQFEMQYYRFYNWPYYGGGSYAWGDTPFIMRSSKEWKENLKQEQSWDPHLRSTKEVTGYRIQALDGEIGHVSDFIIDEESGRGYEKLVEREIPASFIEMGQENQLGGFKSLHKPDLRRHQEIAGVQPGNAQSGI
jgi:hypothetical protein